MRDLLLRYGIQIMTVFVCIAALSLQYKRDSALLSELFSPAISVDLKTNPETEKPATRLQIKPIFGIPPAPQEIQKQQTQKLPETRLELQLKGTFTNSNQKNASAIIAAPNGKSRLFFVGDPIVEGTSLARVETGAIVLSRNGEYEILRLPGMAAKAPESDGFFVSRALSSNNKPIPDITDFEIPEFVEKTDPIVASATLDAIPAEQNRLANNRSQASGESREFVTNVGRAPTPSLRSRLAQLRARQNLD